eukprot:783820-Pleurochrysis_carterae.AAC.1
MLPLCPWRWKRLPRPPCSLTLQPRSPCTETLAPKAVQPDASAVSMEVDVAIATISLTNLRSLA